MILPSRDVTAKIVALLGYLPGFSNDPCVCALTTNEWSPENFAGCPLNRNSMNKQNAELLSGSPGQYEMTNSGDLK